MLALTSTLVLLVTSHALHGRKPLGTAAALKLSMTAMASMLTLAASRNIRKLKLMLFMDHMGPKVWGLSEAVWRAFFLRVILSRGPKGSASGGGGERVHVSLRLEAASA